MRFVAVDVETANPDVGSICQIGMATFVDGQLTEEWSTLVDPEDYFDDVNISIHGVEPYMVRGQPTFPQIADRLRLVLESSVSVCHTKFDRISLSRAYEKYGLLQVSTTWLDSARVVRRTWEDLAWSGYGLASVCRKIGYEFEHHDALEDAKAAGYVLLAAFKESSQGLEQWLNRVNQPIDPEHSSSGSAIRREGNPEGDLYGETVAFTGALEVPRSRAADLAAAIGCKVSDGVTKKTTILIIGNQDAAKLAGHDKSSKHRKAEQLIADGHHIRIIRESDFMCLVNGSKG